MRRVLFAAAAAFVLAGGAAHATGVIDPVGDFLPSYTGPHLADLDVTSFGVTYNAATTMFHLDATMAGPITAGTAGFYVIGVDRGGSGPSPFAGIGAGNVIFNRTIVIQKNGSTLISGNPLTALISGDAFSLDVPLSLLPSTGFKPLQYGFNLWPESAGKNPKFVSDFAPNNANISAAPEPAAWTLMLMGFGALGGLLRTRRNPIRPIALRA